MTFLQGLYIVLGILGGGGVAGLARGLWRMVSAVQRLIGAMDSNTQATAGLAHDVTALRKTTRRRDRELAARIKALEEAHYGQAKPAADPRPPYRSPGRNRPAGRGRMGPP